MSDLDDQINEKIEELGAPPEQAQMVRTMIDNIMGKSAPRFTPTNNPLTAPQGINMFEFTVAVCMAALCVGAPSHSLTGKNLRPIAVGLARSVFTDDGRFIQNGALK
jgi:hypothetical protein